MMIPEKYYVYRVVAGVFAAIILAGIAIGLFIRGCV